MFPSVYLLFKLLNGRLLIESMPLIQRLLQRDTKSGVQPGPDAPLPSSLPESVFLDILSALEPRLDFPQLLATVNEHGQTLLHLAVHLRYRKLGQKLIYWGIDPNVRDVNGSTALHVAYLCDDPSMISVLKTGGAAPFVLDELGRPPTGLMAAIPSTSDKKDGIDPSGIDDTSADQLKERYESPDIAKTQYTPIKLEFEETHPSEVHSGLSWPLKPSRGLSPKIRPATAWPIGGSTQGQKQYYHLVEPVAYQQLGQGQPYQQPLWTSPTYPTPALGYLSAYDRAPHVPSYLAQTSLTFSGETPDWSSGSNVNISGAGMIGDSTSFNQKIGPICSDMTGSGFARSIAHPKRPAVVLDALEAQDCILLFSRSHVSRTPYVLWMGNIPNGPLRNHLSY